LPSWLPLSVLTWAAAMTVFHGVGLGFEWCDRHGKLPRFKQRRERRFGYTDVLPRVLFNQCFILLPCMVLCQVLGLAFSGAPHLSIGQFLAGFLLMGIGHDIVQYAAHRWVLHDRRFSWLGHRLHHAIDTDLAISACYMSAGDFLLNIVLPYLLPLIAIGGGGSDILFQLMVLCLGMLGGLYEHSGYDFSIAAPIPVPGLLPRAGRLLQRLPSALVSSHAHGEHHRLGSVSFSDGFGSPGLCDAILGTRWNASRARADRRGQVSDFW
jgi:sterol desaturase/sphingolipid hydroxylase (fatty acid hydroxylase superfamily)